MAVQKSRTAVKYRRLQPEWYSPRRLPEETMGMAVKIRAAIPHFFAPFAPFAPSRQIPRARDAALDFHRQDPHRLFARLVSADSVEAAPRLVDAVGGYLPRIQPRRVHERARWV